MNKKEILSIVVMIVVLVILIWTYFKKEELVPEPTPTPIATVEVNKQRKYLDQMTAKCYNEEEVEINCEK